MIVPTVPTVPTQNQGGRNIDQPQISAGYSPLVPTVPTFFIMKERKKEAHGISTPLCVLWPNKLELGWNSWNGTYKPQISAPHSRSITGTLAWNSSVEAGTE